MRDVVLAGCIGVFFYSLQGPELVDRWMWLPFMLALCFRNPTSPHRLLTTGRGSCPRLPRRSRGMSAAGWAATRRPSPSSPAAVGEFP